MAFAQDRADPFVDDPWQSPRVTTWMAERGVAPMSCEDRLFWGLGSKGRTSWWQRRASSPIAAHAPTSRVRRGNGTGDLPQEQDATFLVVCAVMGDGPRTLYEKRHEDPGKVAKHYPRVLSFFVTLEACRAPTGAVDFSAS